jgi:3-dehydroquinate synthase
MEQRAMLPVGGVSRHTLLKSRRGSGQDGDRWRRSLWQLLGLAGFTRSDCVVGSAVARSPTWPVSSRPRGCAGSPVVHVPTTLPAMVDAAVGGKTGINIAEGKNLVGAFHEPAAVLCDLDTLATLPAPTSSPAWPRSSSTGSSPTRAPSSSSRADPDGAIRGPARMPELVERSIAVKAHVVTQDLRESWLREILNYGHTFGHAVEQVEGYRWRHGEAVSVGYPDAAGERWSALLTAMSRDKKTRGATLRFVVLDGLAQPGRLEGPSEDLLRAAYREVAG